MKEKRFYKFVYNLTNSPLKDATQYLLMGSLVLVISYENKSTFL